MNDTISFTRRQRFWLRTAAVVGLIGPNAVFLYSAMYRLGDVSAALRNPVALAFMADAAIATVLLACLFAKWRVGRISALWFIVMSLVGGLMFSIPAFVLIGSHEDHI